MTRLLSLLLNHWWNVPTILNLVVALITVMGGTAVATTTAPTPTATVIKAQGTKFSSLPIGLAVTPPIQVHLKFLGSRPLGLTGLHPPRPSLLLLFLALLGLHQSQALIPTLRLLGFLVQDQPKIFVQGLLRL